MTCSFIHAKAEECTDPVLETIVLDANFKVVDTPELDFRHDFGQFCDLDGNGVLRFWASKAHFDVILESLHGHKRVEYHAAETCAGRREA